MTIVNAHYAGKGVSDPALYKRLLKEEQLRSSQKGRRLDEIDAELLIGLAVVKNFGTLQSSLRAK